MSALIVFGKAEPVAADHDAVMQCDAIADPGVFAYRHMGMGRKVVADRTALVDHSMGMQRGICADDGVGADDGIRSNGSSLADTRTRIDDGGRVNTEGWFWRLVKDFERPGKVVIWVLRNQRGGNAG